MLTLDLRARSWRLATVAIAGLVGLAGGPRVAHADDTDAPEAHDLPSTAARSVEAGAFLPSALSPRNDGRRGMVSIMGGWDEARGGGTYDTAAEAQLLGPLSLLAGATYDGPGTSAAPHFELRLDALSQAHHGVDLAVAAGYTDVGFNTVPAAVFKLAVGRNVGPAYVLANLVYDHGLEDGERSGELRVAALYPIAEAVHVGVDSRFEIDLERDDDEPSGETDWEWRSGVVASYTWNRIVFTGTGGVSALRLRNGGSTTTGPLVLAGFGTVF